jgi:formylglycine-generating enzyme required for sulfatase activity
LDYVDQRAGLLVGRGGKPGRPTDYSFPHRTFQEYLAGCYLTGHRQAARKIIDHATEPEYWSLAVEMGAEEIYYNGGTIGVNSVLDLIYRLFPYAEIDTDIKARRSLWTGKMAVLVGSETLRQDDLQDGRVVLEKLRDNLVDIIGERVGVDTNSSITAPERADAGCVLGKLGDPRVEVLAVDAMPLCYIPAGAFLMGSEEGDEEAYEREQPQHEVDLPPYWISRYPITNGQYDQFVQEGGYGQESYWSEAQAAGVWKNGKIQGRWDDDARIAPVDYGEPFNLSNHPVVGVTWYEALAFTRWLTDYWRDQKFLPKDWRVVLPSEAEWEKAARGGLEIPKQSIVSIIQDGLSLSPEKALKPNPLPARIYPWGDDFDANKANASATGIEATSTPGCFSGGASPYGLFDLSGNVWEWTRSLWGKDWQKPDYEYPYDPSDGRENLEAGDSLLRVLRGGSFTNTPRTLRCAGRNHSYPNLRYGHCGFRVCVSPSARSEAEGHL